MRIAVIGTGYVGLVTGVCLADAGNHVVCVDIDAKRVAELDAGRVPFYEPGLQELANFNLEAKRLEYTTSAAAVGEARVVFLAVGTPTGDAGRADLSQLEAAAAAIAPHLKRGTIVVNKSTVPVGTAALVEGIIDDHHEEVGEEPWAAVISNPEFLAEGRAVEDFTKPDRVVVGVAQNRWFDDTVSTMRELYRPFLRSGAPLLFMSRESSELSKYASNGMLATRISYINEIARLCESMDADVEDVRRAMGLDKRIGPHFLYPGIGFGGSCFGKDVRALVAQGQDHKHTSVLLAEVLEVNRRMKHRLPSVIRDGGSGLLGQRIAVWGLAFKPYTDDVRDAPALTVISDLVTYGAERVTCFDPIATDSAVKALDRETHDHSNDVSGGLLKATVDGERVVRFVSDMYEACRGADALVICTEWSAFRSPDWQRLREVMRSRRIYDGRNVLDPKLARENDFTWTGIGRP